jgi:long-chain fatty acid transport protein
MPTTTKLGSCLCVAAGIVFAIPEAQAEAFAVREQSAYGQGSAFAGMAAGGSLSAMFWNPATLADVEGIGS